jgi:prephenate dehydrogenase
MPDAFPFKHIAVFGLGLLGGSLCMAVRKVSPSTHLSAWGRDIRRLFAAKDEGIVDSIGLIAEADLSGVDCVVVSSTVLSSITLLQNILDRNDLSPNSVVIDVGSVKDLILKSVSSHPKFNQFIGCHPMAGSEKKGYGNGRADLYEKSCVIITPNAHNKQEDIEKIEIFWRLLGARTARIDAAIHDRIVAKTSHLPHMSACVLVDLVMELEQKIGPKAVHHGIGKGYRDTTRIAAGSEEVWSEIAALNAENIANAIDDMIERLSNLKKMILETKQNPQELNEYLARIRKHREEIN